LGICSGAHAQSISPSTLNAAGGTGLVGTEHIDWSAAEMALVSTDTGGTGIIVTQGVLQPAPIATGVQEQQLIFDYVQVYPNPASTILNIKCNFPAAGKMTYQLVDVAGRLMISHQADVIAGVQLQQLSVAQLTPGEYMLEVSYQSNEQQPATAVFKIQKLN